MKKLFRLEELVMIREARDNVPFVLATGCFDILHRGHVELLEICRSIADPKTVIGNVAVGLNSDRSVVMLKGHTRPIHKYEDRAFMMSALESVDFVFQIDSLRVTDAIRALRPTDWVKGGDYTLDTLDKDEVKAANEVGAKIHIVPTIGKHSTTNILSKL